jgi:diguanylate cyclase (GGDEF)-like protein/PAS domain S-box-containing protein
MEKQPLNDHNALILWSVDPGLVLTSVSGAANQALFPGLEQMIGKSLAEIAAAGSGMQLPIGAHEQALRGERLVLYLASASGRWEIHLEPQCDRAGRVTGVIGIAQEVFQPLDSASLFFTRQLLESVLANIPQRVYWKDHARVYMGCNQAFAEDAGLESPADVCGKTDFELGWLENSAESDADDLAVMENDSPRLNDEVLAPRADGAQLWVRLNKVPLHDQAGRVTGLLGTYNDITDRKMAEEELQHANEKLILWVEELENRNRVDSLLREMDDLLQVCNYSEEAYAAIHQFCPQLFPGTCGAMFLMDANHRSLEAQVVWGDQIASEHVFTIDECWALRRMHLHSVNTTIPGLRCRHIPADFSGDYMGSPMSAAGEMLGLLHVESSVPGSFSSENHDLLRTVGEHLSLSLSNLRLRETLRSQSTRDALTMLFNRRYMEESLDREISRASRKNISVGLIMLDIDHFKSYNDTYGHDAGDAVLRELGAFLKMHVRAEDIACRYGGEEFILIMPDATLEVTMQRAERVREAVSGMSVVYQRKNLGAVTISVGVAAFPDHARRSDDLLKAADIALYQAKHNGRNRVESA